MNHTELQEFLDLALNAAAAASKEILDVYHSGDFQQESKQDLSPLTIADKKAHQVIVSVLQSSCLPLLSEEGKNIPYEERKNWDTFWLVDPLDGTKEFLKRNGEFTVNIALVENQKPILGVVAVPVSDEVFCAAPGAGAFVNRRGKMIALSPRRGFDLKRRGLRVVASRSHLDQETSSFISGLDHPELVSMGSSLKFMLLAEGKADVYPRFAPTMEWDTAAAHAILNQLNIEVKEPGGQELRYNKSTLLNPYFICY